MEAVREVVVPVNNKIEMMIPDNFIGKTIEIIAQELKDSKSKTLTKKTFDAVKIDLSDFKFNRDDANER